MPEYIIESSAVILENGSQRKPVFWPILRCDILRRSNENPAVPQGFNYWKQFKASLTKSN